MPAALDRLPAAQRARLRPAPEDRSTLADRPMLATLSDRRAFDDRWLFERKLDGVRALAVRDGAGARLLSRTGRVMDGTYPEVVAALAAQECGDFVADGEIVALRDGRTDFSLLQQRMGLTDPRAVRASPVAVFYYVFDLLVLDGWNTGGLPQRTRKALLRGALGFHGPLRSTPHRNHVDGDLLADACDRGWEGLIAKRADAPYQARRSADWLKLKCAAGQEFVIGGFTEPAGSRTGFGALLIGYYDHGDGGDSARLRYAGKVGTGYDRRTLLTLRARLDALAQPRSPFADPVRERAPRWVRPELVAQLGFSEWTRDGMLRHPRFLGLREDRRPAEVVRESAPGQPG
ncbi:non-homologous end-joining DNA ligase [Actinacidiphila sp. ITFR-21]|uniref:non-homologous end-joining DNA ligase n=1 Tax=Actinacidiphila sp. ITFR-21 TaxID=3075199 RepID=UPI0028891A68|nr:non-homologous end-joining DNA ligase [Streptomyces sp. ITFR-21]WNI19651.1 non-homologous end-joining DNA ligase [Streptomyces sp. ITFR-21]